MLVWVFGGFGVKIGIDIGWKYVKPLKSAELINDYERLTGYSLPQEFKNLIIESNGGRPERRVFNTNAENEREIKSFLSFNADDKETVWQAYEWLKDKFGNKYLAFAIDNFGNIICFDTDNGNVVFLNHEDLSAECISATFGDFIHEKSWRY